MYILKLAGVFFVNCCLSNGNDKIHQLQSVSDFSDLSDVTSGEIITHILTCSCVYRNFQ